MKLLQLTILIALLTACADNSQTSKNRATLPDIFEYDGNFYPSFHPLCEVKIIKSGDIGFLKLTVWSYPRPQDDYVSNILKTPIDTDWVKMKTISLKDTRDTVWQDVPRLILYRDSTQLTKEDFYLFFKTLDTVPILKLRPNENYGLDGIMVDNAIKIKNDSAHYKFWSPMKEEPEHKIVEAVFALCRHRFSDEFFQEYFETLEQYFRFGLPCRIISNDPLEIRIYGTISADEHPDLVPFINRIPSDIPVLLDMRNFDGLAVMYFPVFQELNRRNKKVIWVARDKNELNEMGIDTNLVLTDINAARIRLK